MTSQRRRTAPHSHTARRTAWTIPAAVFWLVAATALAAEPVVSPSASARLIVRPADHGEALVNPSMGWTMHFYSNIKPSYMSIHWWPRELLRENRATIARINRRLGYRIQLRQFDAPAEVKLGEPFTVRTRWANAGVAPCYGGGHWAMTLLDAKGGVVSTHVDESFDVRTLAVGPPQKAATTDVASQFTIGLRHLDPCGTFVPAVKPGTYDVYVSVGQRDGTPTIALPMSGDNGQRRYKVGALRIVP